MGSSDPARQRSSDADGGLGSLTLAALDLVDVGIAVFDRDLHLTYCNRHFRTIRGYPEELCVAGVALGDLLLHNARRGDYGDGNPAALAASRVAEIACSGARSVEVRSPGGSILHVRYQVGQRPCDGGPGRARPRGPAGRYRERCHRAQAGAGGSPRQRGALCPGHPLGRRRGLRLGYRQRSHLLRTEPLRGPGTDARRHGDAGRLDGTHPL